MTGEEDAWAWSNLGGLGPDTDAPSQTFRRSKVGKVGNVFIDLVVSNVTEFKPKLQAPGRVVDWSGSVVNGYGQISLDGTQDTSATTHMDLKLSFVEHGTDTPYTLTKFRFAFFDFDRTAPGGIDCLELDTTHIASYSVHPQTELSPPALDLSQPKPKVCATAVGTGPDNPEKNEDAEDLTDEQRKRAIEVTYSNTAEVLLTFSATGKVGITGGRSLIFKGAAPILDACPSPPPNMMPRRPPSPPSPPSTPMACRPRSR